MSLKPRPSQLDLKRPTHSRHFSLTLSNPGSPKSASSTPKNLLSPMSLFNSAQNSPSNLKPPGASKTHVRHSTFYKPDHSPSRKDTFEDHVAQMEQEEAELGNNYGAKFDSPKQEVKVDIEEKKAESMDRLKTIHKYIKQMEAISNRGLDEETSYTKGDTLKDQEKYLDIAESALLVMNLQVKEIGDVVVDSAMMLYPATDKAALMNFYYMLVQEVAEFPYLFLSKLRIGVISICDDVSVSNATYNKVLTQKINNGLFVIKKLQTKEAVKEHWYRIVLYHLVKAEPKFFAQWKELNNDVTGIRKSEMEDLIQTLKCLMQPVIISKVGERKSDPQKMKLLKEVLKKIEPTYFDADWWNMKARQQMG